MCASGSDTFFFTTDYHTKEATEETETAKDFFSVSPTFFSSSFPGFGLREILFHSPRGIINARHSPRTHDGVVITFRSVTLTDFFLFFYSAEKYMNGYYVYFTSFSIAIIATAVIIITFCIKGHKKTDAFGKPGENMYVLYRSCWRKEYRGNKEGNQP